jgi:hypothetical protein
MRLTGPAAHPMGTGSVALWLDGGCGGPMQDIILAEVSDPKP